MPLLKRRDKMILFQMMIDFERTERSAQNFVMKRQQRGEDLSRKDTIEEKTWEMMQPLAKELGLIPVDAEYLKEGTDWILRLTIDKEGGVGSNDCEALSRAIDPKLDEENYISDAYILEVTSPGLGRRLKRPRDFVFAEGKEVDVKLYQALDGQKEWKGILSAHDKDSITISNETETKTFARSDISLIRLTFDF